MDSELCTTCNDCLDINPLLYVYNENNQAYLTETDTATYAQLVEGAEICPSKCIHPGLPQNPNEAGMEELIKRAAPFN
ncbi:ferredoxin [Candidatus Reidiella endopervernicosa]|uniref:ferredoxin n=1 Tax=Candidatus Reidiella endopervernicosa TaxID=2738883 RepID=UPI002A4E174B|nr:ferredoxin [Candidatus Reidiella endopervernicosa]